jgi:SAM-dependent methyltransferase
VSVGGLAGLIARWDAQQARYLPGREERFGLICDLVEQIAPPSPRILDLCAGPGSLSARLLERLPLASITAVDFDPAHIELGHADHLPISAPRIAAISADLLDRWKDEQLAGAEDYAEYRAALRSEPALAEDVDAGDRLLGNRHPGSTLPIAFHHAALAVAGLARGGMAAPHRRAARCAPLIGHASAAAGSCRARSHQGRTQTQDATISGD